MKGLKQLGVLAGAALVGVTANAADLVSYDATAETYAVDTSVLVTPMTDFITSGIGAGVTLGLILIGAFLIVTVIKRLGSRG